MNAVATVKVMSAEEIAAQAGGETARRHWPLRATVFAERQMRLRQLASGHPMADFLLFMSELARCQHEALARFPSVPVPDAAALERAGRSGIPPLCAVDWPRDAAWLRALRLMTQDLRTGASAGVCDAIDLVDSTSDDVLEQQADCLLTGVMEGLELATAPIIAAALQVYWTHLLLTMLEHHEGAAGLLAQSPGHDDVASVCPCCGSRPTISITRGGGQRYLHCSLCSTQWYLERIKCSNCLSSAHIAYQSLDFADADHRDPASHAAKAVVQAETCDDCGHYLKIVHGDRDPFVDPVADDLATLTLDLLVADAGLRRYGVNLLLLFGGAAPPPDGPPGMS